MDDLNSIGTSSSIHKVVRGIKKDTEQSIYNRLRSIEIDSKFVEQVKSKFTSFPLFANLRCGLWYYPSFDGTCYFKSADGHAQHWQLNLARLNLHLAISAAKHGGVIIVDSTRKGKRFPDSFSRTLPIWACTLNRIVAHARKNQSDDKTNVSLKEENSTTETPSAGYSFENLHFPVWVSLSEEEQVEKLISEKFMKNVLISGVDISALVNSLKKPLRCVWIQNKKDFSIYFNSNKDRENYSVDSDLPFTPIVCVSASMTEPQDQDQLPSWYIQGAGDDHESWCQGLTAEMFWSNKNFLLDGRYGSTDIDTRVKHVIQQNQDLKSVRDVTSSDSDSEESIDCFVVGETGMVLGTSSESISDDILRHYKAVLNCSPNNISELQNSSKYLHLPIQTGKADKNKLTKILPKAISFIMKHIEDKDNHDDNRDDSHDNNNNNNVKKILIYSNEGLDHPICISLSVLVHYFDFDGTLLQQPRTQFSKELIRRLFLLIEKYTTRGTAPPRVLMNELNRYFMTPSIFKLK